MTDAAYIFAGYGLTTAVLAGYAGWVITRRKSLARALGLDDRARPPKPRSASPSPSPSSAPSPE